MIRPSIRQLSYLTAIEDHGSFSAAADHCGVTQSTLSAGIKELENILKQQLIIRGRKKATLTLFGQEVAAQAREIINDADKIMIRSQMMGEPLSGPLRLGIIPTIAPYMLPTILPRISRKYPNLELQLFETTSENLIETLNRSQIDLALMAFPYETGDLHKEPLFDEPFYAAAPKGTFGNAKSIQLGELEPDSLLLLEDGHCLREHALEACKLQPIRNSRIFRASSLPTLIEMVRHGYGLTLLPEMACKNASLPSDIDILALKDKPAPTRTIGLCWSENNPRKADFKTLSADIKPD